MDDKKDSYTSSLSTDIFSRDKGASGANSYCKVSGFGLELEVGRTVSYTNSSSNARNTNSDREKR